jgi:hypothetical protein
VLSGYGYKLSRIFLSYALVVLAFAAAFLIPVSAVGGTPTAQNILDTLQSWLATAETVIGIDIESVFVAMLIQRLFR